MHADHGAKNVESVVNTVGAEENLANNDTN